MVGVEDGIDVYVLDDERNIAHGFNNLLSRSVVSYFVLLHSFTPLARSIFRRY